VFACLYVYVGWSLISLTNFLWQVMPESMNVKHKDRSKQYIESLATHITE